MYSNQSEPYTKPFGARGGSRGGQLPNRFSLDTRNSNTIYHPTASITENYTSRSKRCVKPAANPLWTTRGLSGSVSPFLCWWLHSWRLTWLFEDPAPYLLRKYTDSWSAGAHTPLDHCFLHGCSILTPVWVLWALSWWSHMAWPRPINHGKRDVDGKVMGQKMSLLELLCLLLAGHHGWV